MNSSFQVEYIFLMPRIFIPTALREATGGVAEVDSSAVTLRAAIAELEQRWPELMNRLRVGDGLAPGLAVSIDGAINVAGLRANLPPGSEIHFHPAIGGG